MKIEIKDLGPIKSGVIDLSKKLNVFCGPNGTGKTYAAYVVYGVLGAPITLVSDDYWIDLDELIKKKKIKVDINFDLVFKHKTDTIDYINQELFHDIFGISKDLVSDYFNNRKVLLGETKEEFKARLLATEFERNVPLNGINISVLKKKDSDFITLIIDEQLILLQNDNLKFIRMGFDSAIMDLLENYPINHTYIFPVERNSIFTFSKELSIRRQEALDEFHKTKNPAQLLRSTNRYPLPIKDGLKIAEDLAEIKKTKSQFYDFALEIEKELLHGKVEVSGDGELQYSPDKASKIRLPIQITASIIKSLSSLVIYLKYMAKENDLIIIDEPEINLHPDNQISLTRIFARLIHKGFRLLISTHSDYIIRELNNLIMLGSDKPEMLELRGKYGYASNETLSAADVAVSYFNFPNTKNKNKQVSIQNLEVDETGFEVPSIDETIEQQNRISEDLYYTLKYGEDE